MQQLYRMLAAAPGWFALGLQYVLIVRYKTDGDLIAAAIRFSSYFTLLSNILVALAMTLPWLMPESRPGLFFSQASVRTAIAVYIIIVAAIYHFILRHLWNPEGWQFVADTIEHVVAPALYVIDLLVFVSKGTLQAKSVLTWMLFPFAYAAYSLMHGAVMGFYPYPFLDVAALGYEQVLLNMGLLIVVFAGLGLLLVGSRAWPLASAKDGLESPRHRQKKLVNRLVRLRRERWTHHTIREIASSVPGDKELVPMAHPDHRGREPAPRTKNSAIMGQVLSLTDGGTGRGRNVFGGALWLSSSSPSSSLPPCSRSP